MKKYKYLILFLLIGCSYEPYQLVEQSFELMEKHSINSDKIDWDSYPTPYLNYAKKNNSIEVAHELIYAGLYNLEDGHSSLITKEQYDKYFSEKSEIDIPKIDSMLIDDKYGYIKIPPFLSQDKKDGELFARAIQKEIFNLNNAEIKGWIVDLSENSGGNLWPMLAGLSPILKKGVLGYFYKGEDIYIPWSYDGNKLKENGKTVTSTFHNESLFDSNLKIGVIIGEKTGSSGEALVISLMAQPNSKTFGKQTYGLTTGNSVFKLKDGSRILIASSKYADSKKHIVENKLSPDVVTDYPLEEIKSWIN